MGPDAEKALGHKHILASRKQQEMKIPRTVLSKEIVSRLQDSDKYSLQYSAQNILVKKENKAHK